MSTVTNSCRCGWTGPDARVVLDAEGYGHCPLCFSIIECTAHLLGASLMDVADELEALGAVYGEGLQS